MRCLNGNSCKSFYKKSNFDEWLDFFNGYKDVEMNLLKMRSSRKLVKMKQK